MNLLSCSLPRIEVLKDVQALVVDNDRDALYLYTVFLQGCGADVVTAASVKEAIEILGWLLPDVLICEIRFRGESIDALTTKLREMQKRARNRIPAIAITAWVTDRLAQILDAGFEGYLLKPIDLDALIAMIETRLSNASVYNACS